MPDPARMDDTFTSQPIAAPVAFFVFNRPAYTRRVFDVIRQAKPPRLLVVADGARPEVPEDADRVREVRDIITRGVDWQCEVRTNYASANLGCRERFASGLHWVFEHEEAAIILEDDCLPDLTFFRFCTELLDRYRNEPRVGMIAGTNYREVGELSGDSYFFSGHHSIWGWATWRRAFAGYDVGMRAWRSTVHPRDLRDRWRDRRSRFLHTTMFDLAREDGVSTWDIAWSLHLVSQGALSAVPACNLISNIGLEGVRGRKSDDNNLRPTAALPFPLQHPTGVFANADYDRLVAGRHRIVRDWLRAKWRHRLRRFFASSRVR